LDIRNGIRAAAPHRLDAARATIRELISLTYLLHTGGYLSRQNTEILGNALDELGQFFTFARNSSLSDAIHLKREDFLPGDASLPRRERVGIPSAVGPIEIGGKAGSEDARKGGGRITNDAVHSERQQLIIDILKKGGKLGIKDITSQMVGCSEKTVQRELAVLVKSGIVQKDGEKRWSGYVLV
jgi:predicted transcriptional regulator